MVALFDGDEAKERHAPHTKDLCPTFVYRSDTHSNPELEDALIFGLPREGRECVRIRIIVLRSAQLAKKKERDAGRSRIRLFQPLLVQKGTKGTERLTCESSVCDAMKSTICFP